MATQNPATLPASQKNKFLKIARDCKVLGDSVVG